MDTLRCEFYGKRIVYDVSERDIAALDMNAIPAKSFLELTELRVSF